MGDLDLSLDGALEVAGSIFNDLASVAATGLGIVLGMIVVSIVISYMRWRNFKRW